MHPLVVNQLLFIMYSLIFKILYSYRPIQGSFGETSLLFFINKIKHTYIYHTHFMTDANFKLHYETNDD